MHGAIVNVDPDLRGAQSPQRFGAIKTQFFHIELDHVKVIGVRAIGFAKSGRTKGTEAKALPYAEAISWRLDGVVTSLKEEHENSASQIFSNDRDCLAPHVHSRRAKGSVRPCRSEMTLDVESVVGGCS